MPYKGGRRRPPDEESAPPDAGQGFLILAAELARHVNGVLAEQLAVVAADATESPEHHRRMMVHAETLSRGHPGALTVFHLGPIHVPKVQFRECNYCNFVATGRQ